MSKKIVITTAVFLMTWLTMTLSKDAVLALSIASYLAAGCIIVYGAVMMRVEVVTAAVVAIMPFVTYAEAYVRIVERLG